LGRAVCLAIVGWGTCYCFDSGLLADIYKEVRDTIQRASSSSQLLLPLRKSSVDCSVTPINMRFSIVAAVFAAGYVACSDRGQLDVLLIQLSAIAAPMPQLPTGTPTGTLPPMFLRFPPRTLYSPQQDHPLTAHRCPDSPRLPHGRPSPHPTPAPNWNPNRTANRAPNRYLSGPTPPQRWLPSLSQRWLPRFPRPSNRRISRSADRSANAFAAAVPYRTSYGTA